MPETVFTLPGSVVRKKLMDILEIEDESDKLVTFHQMLKEFGNEALVQNQIIFLEKKFRKLSQLYDSLVFRKKHLIFLMEAYDFSNVEHDEPEQLKLFELLPQVLENDLDQLSIIQKEIAIVDQEKNNVLTELLEL